MYQLTVDEKFLRPDYPKWHIIILEAANYALTFPDIDLKVTELKTICDSKIKSLKMGVAYPKATFYGDLKDLQADKKLLAVKKVPIREGAVKYYTYVEPNVERIREHFERLETKKSLDELDTVRPIEGQGQDKPRILDATIEQRKIGADFWQQKEKKVLEKQLKEEKQVKSIFSRLRWPDRQLEEIEKSFIDCGCALRSSRWDLRVAFDSGKMEKDFFLNPLATAALFFALQTTRMSYNQEFTLVARYKGPLRRDEDPITSAPSTVQKTVVDSFCNLMGRAYSFRISDEQRAKLEDSVGMNHEDLEKMQPSMDEAIWLRWLKYLKGLRLYIKNAESLIKFAPIERQLWKYLGL